MPISCHFRYCKALLSMCSSWSSAISSTSWPLPLYIYLFQILLFQPLHNADLRCTSYTGIYFCCNMTLIAIISVINVVILYILHHYQDKPVPPSARKVCCISNCFLPRDACGAKCGIAIVSRPSICLSVTLMHRGHNSWTRSKVITRISSLASSSSERQHRQEKRPKILARNRGGVGSLFWTENLQYLWNGARQDQG